MLRVAVLLLVLLQSQTSFAQLDASTRLSYHRQVSAAAPRVVYELPPSGAADILRVAVGTGNAQLLADYLKNLDAAERERLMTNLINDAASYGESSTVSTALKAIDGDKKDEGLLLAVRSFANAKKFDLAVTFVKSQCRSDRLASAFEEIAARAYVMGEIEKSLNIYKLVANPSRSASDFARELEPRRLSVREQALSEESLGIDDTWSDLTVAHRLENCHASIDTAELDRLLDSTTDVDIHLCLLFCWCAKAARTANPDSTMPYYKRFAAILDADKKKLRHWLGERMFLAVALSDSPFVKSVIEKSIAEKERDSRVLVAGVLLGQEEAVATLVAATGPLKGSEAYHYVDALKRAGKLLSAVERCKSEIVRIQLMAAALPG